MRPARTASRAFACWALFALAWPAAVLAARTEYEVKAAFIHNIAKFIDWPAGAGEGRQRLCVLGDEPLAPFAATLQDKPIGRGNWQVQAVTRAGLAQCRVLFIAGTEAADLRRILDGLRGSPVLTVGDTDGFAAQGVMVNFYLEQNKVRFEINIEAAHRAGLIVSSQLLKLARVVADAGGAR